jgi:predicted SAM-dependent methyltransferase
VGRMLSATRRPLGTRRLRRAIERGAPPFKIELGAAGTRRDGWLCTDVHWRASLFLDATRRWPLADASVSHVYADNVIEHLQLDANRALLSEAARVLMPGGWIRLVTPDVARLVALYLDRTGEAEWHLARARTSGYVAEHRVDI